MSYYWLYGWQKAAIAVVGAAVSVYACASATANKDAVTAAHEADVAAYAAEQLACVAQSATSGEAHDCIAGVQTRWCSMGAPLALAGACGDAGIVTPATAASQAAVVAHIDAMLDAMTPKDAGAGQ